MCPKPTIWAWSWFTLASSWAQRSRSASHSRARSSNSFAVSAAAANLAFVFCLLSTAVVLASRQQFPACNCTSMLQYSPASLFLSLRRIARSSAVNFGGRPGPLGFLSGGSPFDEGGLGSSEGRVMGWCGRRLIRPERVSKPSPCCSVRRARSTPPPISSWRSCSSAAESVVSSAGNGGAAELVASMVIRGEDALKVRCRR